ncbi:flagellar biosynthesis protein FlhF [Polaromonas sp. OV174]|uniref:flagellar biosynthesis protein FlhF n=1 Tax=Polaromonas sp. OV174 TaxID=1855300 RepID=UPI0015A65E5A|nr:flagellar biosynthesis protein FlhF [Polaromonas sp. OV174]
METCKIVAPSSRQALRLVREKLGPDAIVLSNRVTAEGIEIVATLEETIAAISATATSVIVPRTLAVAAPANSKTAAPAPGDGDSVLREIHSMRGMIEEQLAGIAWNEAQRRDPLRGQLLRTLLGAGFSARLAKDLLANLPTGQNYASGMHYVKSAMARQMPMLEDEDSLMDEGGVYALMGPTGVGKTTTTAKLAARCVMRFGADKLALVTTDSYRIGAYEQLRIYGQILGVVVHAVKDAVDLELVLSDLKDKHMVLIDTVGMSQRDRAVSEQISMLCGATRPVKRLLLLNASSHGDTLNEVVQAYRHGGQAGSGDLTGCIFTKVDEATHPGALIDTVIRHQLPIHYISSGQKVPEHLMLGDRDMLIDSVFQAKSQSALFVPGEADLDERPAALRNEAQVAAAQAVSERLRSQCQQLIRTLAHDVQELTANATALAEGQIGFEETRVLWRQLADAQLGEQALAQTLLAQAGAQSRVNCSDYILMSGGEVSPSSGKKGGARVPVSMLLSDNTGLPFAALPGKGVLDLGQAQALEKPVVHLFAAIPAFRQIHEWRSSGLQWVACAPANLRVMSMASASPETLGKLAEGLSFSAPRPVMFRKKSALLSVAEAWVSLRPDPKHEGSQEAAHASMLRCVVRRIVDAQSGKLLAHSYVLASADIQASAQQIAQWPAWQRAAEACFKLISQGLLQLGDSGAASPLALRNRVLIAAQACTTVLRLQNAPGDWAETARNVLAQLAGRSLRSGRAVPGAALFEGLGKLFVLLDALESDGSTVSPQSDMAAVQG